MFPPASVIMTDDILNTTQNPDELRRLATALLTAPGIREAGCMAHVRRKFMELYRMNVSIR